MGVELGKAVFNITADDSGLDSKLKSSEQKVEASANRISAKMVAMSAAIGGALGSVLGGYVTKLLAELDKIPSFFEDSAQATARYGEEMADLGARMGMTAQDASTLTGILERQGIGAGVASRSMQILSAEMRMTTEALNPLHTRLGSVLGTLRDSNGAILNTSQVLDLARQKIQATTGATQQLELAQRIFGTRMGGQLVSALKMSNDEWAQQKKSVEASLGPVGEAADVALKYKEASEELDQVLRGIQLTIGTQVLPTIISLTKGFEEWVKSIENFKANDPLGLTLESIVAAGHDVNTMFNEMDYAVLKWQEVFGQTPKVSSATFALLGGDIKGYLAEIEKAKKALEALSLKKSGGDVPLSDLNDEDLAKRATAQQQLSQAAEKAQKIGLITSQQRLDFDSQDLAVIEEQLTRYEKLLESGTAIGQVRVEFEMQVLQLQERQAQILERQAQDQYAEQELRSRALGQVNSTTEIEFMQQQLADSRIIGDERLKIEASLFSAKQKYAEDAMKAARQLGIAQVGDEIKYRQEKTKDLLSRGDILGAAGQMKEIQDLRIKEADSQMEYDKKIQIISIQSEIAFQRQKLEMVKGSAEEERKVIESIADLDKQMYEKRIQNAANYTSDLNKLSKGVLTASAAGESMTPEQAKIEAERTNTDAGRQARSVAEHGGSDEERAAAISWAEGMKKKMEDMATLGESASERMSASWDDAKDVFEKFGVKDVHDPTGPSAAVGSALSNTEGLSTTNLGRGSQIPNLDTSFADLAIRVRDVFLGTIPNITSFSDAIKQATTKITGSFGNPINSAPGGGSGPSSQQFGPGSGNQPLPTGPSSPAQPQPISGVPGATGTSSFGGTVIPQVVGISELPVILKNLSDRLNSFKDATDSLATTVAEMKKPQQMQIQVGFDPNSQDGLTAKIQDTVATAIA